MFQTISDIMLWIGFALMTAAALWLILRPLATRQDSTAEESEVALYKDQLEELARDVERGVIKSSEAESARTEIARRLLAADAALAAERSAGKTVSTRLRKIVAVSIFLFVPAATLAIYLSYGSPELPGQSFASRTAGTIDQLPLEALIWRVEQEVKKNPSDIKGREILATAYFEQQRYADAAIEWTRIMQAEGVTAPRLSARAEADLFAQGHMNAAIRASFEQVERLDPADPRAQYYLGIADINAGQKDEAIKRWKAFLASAPENASWRPKFEDALQEAERSGPSSADIEAADDMTEEDRRSMIDGMVAGLADRLAQNPNDLEGWIRLVGAYGVLGRDEDQKKALNEAKAIFAEDKAALERLEAASQATNTRPRDMN